MDIFLKDVKYAIRSLLKHPGFTAVAVATLAVGLGANTAIFTFFNGVLLRPLPFPDSDRLVVLSEKNPQKNKPPVVSPRNLEDWEKQSQTVEQFGAWRDWHFSETTSEGTAGIASAICSPSLFRVLGVQPIRGRLFAPEENQPGRDHVVLISSSYWKSRFGSDEKVIGQTMILDKQPFTIAGVLPPELDALNLGTWDVWAPLTVDPDQFLGRQARNRRVYARLKPGVNLVQAQSEMTAISARLAAQYPKENAGWTASVANLQEDEVGDLRTPMFIFLGAVGLVLLIACTNVANLLLARAASRRKEFAVRVALGASRFQLLRQLLTESVLLSLIGGAAGIVLAIWLIDLFIAIIPNSLPRVEEIKLDATVLVFAFGLSLITGILFGLAPGLQSSRVNLVHELKDAPGLFRSRGTPRLRAVLVVSQIALALILLVGAGLLGQTFVRLLKLKPGYDPQNLLTTQVFVPDEKYKSKEQVSALYSRITGEIQKIPGVLSVGASSGGPQFGGSESLDVLPEGAAAPASGIYPEAFYFNIGPNYFRTMGIPLIKGRDVAETDNAGAPPVVIINETLARRFWPDESPIGKRLTLITSRNVLEIIGVVGDTKRFGLGTNVQPEIYFPYMQRPRWATYLVVRTRPEASASGTLLSKSITNLDSELVVSNPTNMDQRIGRSLRKPRFNLILLGIFAGAALLLAAIGVYGVMSFIVAEQTREIGIRSALGAKRSDILKLVIGRGMILALIGVGTGTLIALALTRFLAGLLYGVSGSDPITFAAVAALLLLAVGIACYLPARRAITIDPLIALRTE
jgi:putative ABC transport system permease protein